MEEDIVDIWLESVTIFWTDLGMPKRSHMTRQQDDHYADFWDSTIQPWLNQTMRNNYNPHNDGVWFTDRKDAMLFKLTWAGQIPPLG